MNIPFKFNIRDNNTIFDFAEHNNDIYAGTGPEGKLLKSEDGIKWGVFKTLDEMNLTTLHVWGDSLYVGTMPNGVIYRIGLADNSFKRATIEDSKISAFARLDSKLYVGTSPMGKIYELKDGTWQKINQIWGKGITSMTSNGVNIYVFVKGQESPYVFDGANLSVFTFESKEIISDYEIPENNADNRQTTVSNIENVYDIFDRDTTKSINREKVLNINDIANYSSVIPPVADYRISSSALTDNSIVFSGKRVYEMTSSNLNVLAHIGSSSAIAPVANNKILVSSEGQVILIDKGGDISPISTAPNLGDSTDVNSIPEERYIGDGEGLFFEDELISSSTSSSESSSSS